MPILAARAVRSRLAGFWMVIENLYKLVIISSIDCRVFCIVREGLCALRKTGSPMTAFWLLVKEDSDPLEES